MSYFNGAYDSVEEEDNSLMHFGVKGMKWGVRRKSDDRFDKRADDRANRLDRDYNKIRDNDRKMKTAGASRSERRAAFKSGSKDASNRFNSGHNKDIDTARAKNQALKSKIKTTKAETKSKLAAKTSRESMEKLANDIGKAKTPAEKKAIGDKYNAQLSKIKSDGKAKVQKYKNERAVTASTARQAKSGRETVVLGLKAAGTVTLATVAYGYALDRAFKG